MALFRPAFLRSTFRESRVRKPPTRSLAQGVVRLEQRLGDAVLEGSRLAAHSAARDVGGDIETALGGVSGMRTSVRSRGRPKYSSTGRLLTVILPSPGVRITRAMAVLRLPVAVYLTKFHLPILGLVRMLGA